MERHISARRSCNYVMTRSRRGREKSKSGGFENRFRKLPVPFDFRSRFIDGFDWRFSWCFAISLGVFSSRRAQTCI
jgi:hypothetical protein